MKRLIALIAVLLLLLSVPVYAEASGIFDLRDKSSISYEADLEGYYLSEMIDAAKRGDVEAGRTACRNRDEIIARKEMDAQALSFDDLYLLARLIHAEAGSDWLTDEFRMCIGEVVMNRVASPEFPNTLSEVVYQKGQYSCVTKPGFESLVPGENFVYIALELLRGERVMAGSVVYCSSMIQGDVFSVYEDWRLGVTYFCVSPNIELYPLE